MCQNGISSHKYCLVRYYMLQIFKGHDSENDIFISSSVISRQEEYLQNICLKNLFDFILN